jgi:hypothetical protein
MPPTIDPQYATAAQPRSSSSRRPERPDLPDVHERPRKRMHPILVAGIASVVVAAAIYGTEAFAPADVRPTRFIGDYNERLHEATKSGELHAQIRYDAQLRGIEIQYQTVLKGIETEGVQWQERCRTGLQAFAQHYQAVYQRANTLAQGVVQLQQGYQSMRNQIMAGTLGGETALINLLNTLAPMIALFDPNAARQLSAIAQDGRRQLLATFDREARNVSAISVRGWDTGLPRPESLPTPIRCDVPVFRTAATAAPIQVPQVTAPRR